MEKDFDIIIIGGGPAGLAAAVYAGRGERKTLVMERGLMGGQVAQTMDIANYPGFPESVDGPELAEKMRAHAERYGVEFRQVEARDIAREDGVFRVSCRDCDMHAKAVIVATGSTPRKLGVTGEEEFRGRGVSYCGTCDAPFFRNKKVIVVGGGDSAFKESLHIAKFASRIVLVHRSDSFRAEKIYRHKIATTEKIEVRTFTELREIRGRQSVQQVVLENNRSGEMTEEPADGVFVFIGSVPNTKLICSLVPANCGGHVETDPDMMTSVPGLFAIGDVREHSYRQVATAVGEGATAAMAAEHYLERAGESGE